MNQAVKSICILILLVCMPAIAQQPPMKPPSAPAGLGFNLHIMGPDQDWDAIKAAGVRLVRKDFIWEGVERTRGQYDFAAYDRMLDGLDARGIRTLFILDYRNPLYGDPETTDEGREAYAKWAAASAGHFKGRNVVWEIWNEPNVGFWKGKGGLNSPEFADEYVALVKKTVPAMRAADPDCYILGGSVSCLWRDSFRWLDEAFKQGLLQSGINALSVHPYGFSRPELCIDPSEPGAVKDGYAVLREMMAKAGAARDLPVVNSEVGYPAEKKVTLRPAGHALRPPIPGGPDVRRTHDHLVQLGRERCRGPQGAQPRPGAAARLRGLQEHDAGDGRLPFRGAAQGGRSRRITCWPSRTSRKTGRSSPGPCRRPATTRRTRPSPMK